MENLVNILREKTQDLKNQFIEKTAFWATAHYEYVMMKDAWRAPEWCNYFGIKTETINKGTMTEFEGYPRGFYSTKYARELDRVVTKIKKYKRLGLEGVKKLEIEKAEKHYEDSLLKLADRILRKGVNTDNMNITYSRIGVNIDITINCGDKTVKAWTIIAEGVVQRPHYRYLVK